MPPTLTPRVLLKALVAMFVFGMAPASIRAVSMDAYSLGILRLAAAALLMGAILRLQGKLSFQSMTVWSRRNWLVLAAMGLIFGLHWLTYFLSIKWASAATGAIGFTTYGVQLPLLGWAFGFGRPTWQMWLALAIALVGAAFCLPQWEYQPSYTPGLAIGILSGTFYAALPLLHQRFADIGHGVRVWGQFGFALPLFLCFWPLAEWHFEWADLPWLLNMLLVITVVGHYFWVDAITDLPVQVTAVLAYLQLPISVFMSWLLIGEQITSGMLIGAALVVVGNIIAVQAARAREYLDKQK